MKIKEGGGKVDLNLQDSVTIAILLNNSCKPMQQQFLDVVYLVSLIVCTSSSCAPIAPLLGLGGLVHS